MRTLHVIELLSLDGVMQAPGAPDEDTSGGFEHGGWAAPYTDEVIGREMGKSMGEGELVLGRRTYELLRAAWAEPREPNQYSDVLNATRKYVASRTLDEPLPWQHSTLLDGEAADAVGKLKDEDGPDLRILGSGELVRALLDAGLVDRFTLLIHPLVLGNGKRLFAGAGPLTAFKLTNSVPSTTGVVIATYERSGEAPKAKAPQVAATA